MIKTAVFLLISLSALPALAAEEPRVGSAEWLRGHTADAIAISRIAERLCPGLVVDKNIETMALNAFQMRTWAELPRDRVERAMAGFARDPDGACDYAWTMYGIGSGGSHNLSFRFLRRVVRNPF